MGKVFNIMEILFWEFSFEVGKFWDSLIWRLFFGSRFFFVFEFFLNFIFIVCVWFFMCNVYILVRYFESWRGFERFCFMSGFFYYCKFLFSFCLNIFIEKEYMYFIVKNFIKVLLRGNKKGILFLWYIF